MRFADGIVAFVLAIVVVGAGSSRMVPRICGLWHDDAIYVVTARSLAEEQAYRLNHLPGSPNQTKYPLFFPSALAVVWLIWPAFPDNVWIMQGLCLLSCAAAVGLGYLYLVRFRYSPRTIAAAAGLLCATTPHFLFYGAQVMTEMPFALLTVIAFWSLDAHLAARPKGRVRQICLGLVLTLPFWCRTAGVIFMLCGLPLIRRAGRPVRWVAAGAASSILPWIIWTVLGLVARNDDQVMAYYTDYLGWWSHLGLPLLPEVFVSNVSTLLLANVEIGMEGCNDALLELAMRPSFLPWCVAAHMLLLIVGLSAWLPIARQAQQGRALPWCIAGYLLLITCWPWPPARFLIPILPILVMYMMLGVSWLVRRCCGTNMFGLGIVAISVAVTINAVSLYRHAQLTQRTGCPASCLAGNRAHWDSYERLFKWIRASTEADAVVATEKDPMLYLYTNRLAFRPFVHRPGACFYGVNAPKLGTVEEFARTLQVRRPAYVVMTPMEFYDQPFAQLIGEARERYPGWLRRVYQDPRDPRFAVFAVNAEKEPVLVAPEEANR
jgi:hypothetical protein